MDMTCISTRTHKNTHRGNVPPLSVLLWTVSLRGKTLAGKKQIREGGFWDSGDFIKWGRSCGDWEGETMIKKIFFKKNNLK